jgi:hypothetical protein
MTHGNGKHSANGNGRKRPKTGAKTTGQPVGLMVSPLNGATCPTGAHPGNTGGKVGRSGRKPDEFREVLAAVRDERGLGVVEDILRGEIVYTLRGKCEKCGHEAEGLEIIDPAKLVPSPDTRLRAAEITFKHTLPAEKVIRLEGFPGVQRAFEVVKARIRAQLSPEVAERVIADIHEHMAGL